MYITHCVDNLKQIAKKYNGNKTWEYYTQSFRYRIKNVSSFVIPESKEEVGEFSKYRVTAANILFNNGSLGCCWVYFENTPEIQTFSLQVEAKDKIKRK